METLLQKNTGYCGPDNYEDYEDDNIGVCDKCGDTHDIDDLIYFDDTMMCDDCIDEYTTICDDCGKRYWNDDGYSDNNRDLCQHCYDYNYSKCDECCCLIHNDYIFYHDGYDEYNDFPYCESCYENHKNRSIHDYNYRPEPLFYGSGLFYGVELEIDDGGKNHNNATEVLDIANGDEERLYCKADGSIHDGFEMVSHPMSLDYHMNTMPWRKVLSRALHMGYKSHYTTTCGLHVHVGRKELGDSYESQEEVIARIAYFIEKHWDNMLQFSRRTEAQINQWAARYGCKENAKATLKHAKDRYGRYVCLNLQNYNTIEFRIFRGTLKYSTFIAVLQLVDAICNAAISMSDEKLEALSWREFLATINESKKPELIQYLKERRLYELPLEAIRESE